MKFLPNFGSVVFSKKVNSHILTVGYLNPGGDINYVENDFDQTASEEAKQFSFAYADYADAETWKS